MDHTKRAQRAEEIAGGKSPLSQAVDYAVGRMHGCADPKCKACESNYEAIVDVVREAARPSREMEKARCAFLSVAVGRESQQFMRGAIARSYVGEKIALAFRCTEPWQLRNHLDAERQVAFDHLLEKLS